MLFLCCHPALSPTSQIALTLRAVGGLTTEQIAGASLVPDTTMGQRISRAKQRIKAAGSEFVMPPEPERAERLGAVLHVLYLIFNEGYAATSGPDLVRAGASLAVLLEKRTPKATFLGEASGGAPNFWADPETVTLPNSNLRVLIASRYFGIGGPNDTRTRIEPDLPVQFASTAYFSGRDPVLEAALSGKTPSRRCRSNQAWVRWIASSACARSTGT